MILKWAAVMAVVVRASGFAIGFVGPMIFMPDSNQGPLLGILITGPAGVVLGALIGCVVGFVKRSLSH